MTHFDDDDQLISGAFADFNDAAAPTVRAAGTASLHTKAIRYRRTRATLIGLAGVLIFALPVATYAALGQQNQGPPPVPGDSPTAGTGTPSPSQTKAQQAFSIAYFAVGVNDKVEVYAYKDGNASLKATISDPYGTVRATLTVSPDESSLAWVDDDNLIVSGIDGSQRRTLITGVPGAGQSAPMWTADSKRLVTVDGSVDVATKQVTADPLKGYYQVLSPGNQFTAYVSATGGQARVIVEGADGSKTAEVPTICNGCESNSNSVLAVSPDGRYVALGGWPTAGERESSWREILDTRTGQMVLNLERPAGPKSGRFLADGTFVLHENNKMNVVKLDGTVVSTFAMPGPLKVHNESPPLRYPVLLLVK